MSEKMSEAKRKYWADKSKEERSAHASHMVSIRHKNMSKEEKERLISVLKNAKSEKKGI